MDDLVSRRATIEALEGIGSLDTEADRQYARTVFEDLPSAQPDVPDTNVGDTISRQVAIDALDEIESEVADGYGYQYEKWRKYFCELPSAQPQIIYCAECTHWKHSAVRKSCEVFDWMSKAEDFCSFAERREG